MPVVPRPAGVEMLGEFAEQWGPTALRWAGATPVTAPLAELAAQRVEDPEGEIDWRAVALAGGLAMVPFGAIIRPVTSRAGSVIGRALQKAKAARAKRSIGRIVAYAAGAPQDDVLQIIYNELARAPRSASQGWSTGMSRTVRAYRGHRGMAMDPLPGRGAFLSLSPGDAYQYAEPPYYTPERLRHPVMIRKPRQVRAEERRWDAVTRASLDPIESLQHGIEQFDVTVENPLVFTQSMEPHDVLRRAEQATTELEWSGRTDLVPELTIGDLEAAGISRRRVRSVLHGPTPHQQADRLLQQYLVAMGHDAAVFPASDVLQLVDRRPRLP